MGTCAGVVIRTASITRSRMKNAMPCAPETRRRNVVDSGEVPYLQLVSHWKTQIAIRVKLLRLFLTQKFDGKSLTPIIFPPPFSARYQMFYTQKEA